MSEDNNPETLAKGGDNTSKDGEGTASKDVSVAEVLSSTLGKDFKDDDTALKAVKDTFNYVGGMGKYKETLKALESKLGVSGEEAVLQRMEEVAKITSEPRDTSDVSDLRKQVEDLTFYKDNPKYEGHRDLLNELRNDTGKSLPEIIKSETLQGVLEKAMAHDEVQKSKSVLESNPRLGQVRDKMKEATESAQTDPRRAAELATQAVLEAFEK